MISARVTIVNRLGLHARAASRLVNCASAFASEVHVVRGARAVNAKSIMGVLTLAAGLGSELEIQAHGSDEQRALDAVVLLIQERFGEDQ